MSLSANWWRGCPGRPSGGEVIERAAILAEGADFTEIVGWITDHAVRPETAISSHHGGLHSDRLDERARTGHTPLRYVLPAGALD